MAQKFNTGCVVINEFLYQENIASPLKKFIIIV